MITYNVKRTTDNKFLGASFSFPEEIKPGSVIPVGEYTFDVVHYKHLYDDIYEISNYNYIVIAKKVEE
jgi:hypothetical protein